MRNPAARRGCAALLISGAEHTLIDAGPDLRMQLSLARAQDVDQVLFTHEHFDHIGGIPEFEFYVRLRSQKPLALYAGDHTLAAIGQQFAFMAETLDPHAIEAWQSKEFDGVRYTALPATHGVQTYGFLIEKAVESSACACKSAEASHKAAEGHEYAAGSCCEAAENSIAAEAKHQGGKRIAYFPDTGPLAPEVQELLKGIDVLIIDASFNGRNWMPQSHLTITEAIALAQQLGAKKTFLTHLAMHYDEPITAAELQELLAPYGGAILAANDGLEIRF